MAKVLVSGVGRMGRLVVKELAGAGHRVVAAVDVKASGVVGRDVGELSGVGVLGVKVEDAGSLPAVLKRAKPEVAVDFSSPASCAKNMVACMQAGCSVVVGTTGLSKDELSALKKAAAENKVAAVVSPNMSLGVNVFWRLCAEAARPLKGYDVEIIDAHHRFKRDAPSGTGLKAAEVIAEAAGIRLPEKLVYGRRGDSLRKDGEIGIHAIRAGSIVGEHTVLFASPTERVEIRHVAHSREAFAGGVVSAVEFVKGKKGVYSMADVLGL